MHPPSSGTEEAGAGPFLWLSPLAPPRGWRGTPPGGMCLCAFLFVRQGERVLLGRYAAHPAWREICGMEEDRVRANSQGWTIPASHLIFGEDPRDASRRVGETILELVPGLHYTEPAVATFFYEPAAAPGKMHYDVLFLCDLALPTGVDIRIPPWYAALEWFDIGALEGVGFARQHGDVAEAWLKARAGR